MTTREISWLNQSLGKSERRRKPREETDQVIIIDNLCLDPEDYRLTPEEYALLYENRRWGGLSALSVAPGDHKEKRMDSTTPISWLSGSVSTDREEAEVEPVVIIEEHPARTLELTPEEYKKNWQEVREYEAHLNELRERGLLL